MNIENMTIKEAREIAALFNTSKAVADNGPWEIGKCYLIRTVTMIQTGRCVAVHDKEICLEDAAWIADTGRFSDSLLTLDFSEVEPFPDGSVILVGRGSIVDAVQIAKPVKTRK